MANGYIGKISAVVTANTADLSAKLRGSVQEVNKFANALNSSITAASRSATQSLQGIFTPLQKLERNIQAALQGNVFRTDDVDRYVQGIRQAVSVSEQLNKPLGAAATSFTKLSLEVQAAFLPALDRAQTAVVELSNTLTQQGSVSESAFGKAESAIQRTIQAVQRLSEAQQLVRSGFSGQELQFASPRAFETLQQSAGQRAAGNLPAALLEDGRVAAELQRIKQLENQVAQRQAEVDAARIQPSGGFALADIKALVEAERRLEAVIRATRQAKQEFDGLVESRSAGLDFVSRQGDANEEFGPPRNATRLPPGYFEDRQRSAELERSRRAAEAAAQAMAGLSQAARGALSGLPQTVDEADTEFRSLLSTIEGLSAAQRATFAPITNELLDLFTTARNGTGSLDDIIDRLARVRAATGRGVFGPIPDSIIREQEAALGSNLGRATDLQAGRAGERRRAARDAVGLTDASPSAVPRELEAVGGKINSLRGQIESLPAALRSGLTTELRSVQAQFVALAGSVRPSVAEVAKLERAVARVSANSRRANLASTFRDTFGGAGRSGITANLNEQALRGYSAQLELLQQTIGRASSTARGPAVAAFARLRDAIAAAMNSGELETAQAQQRIELFRQTAIKAAAAAAEIGAGGLDRRLSRVGDVARGSFSNAGLAIQQAVFAVEDFFSVTGGLDQRVRAAGNNISQLGFILGGTTGLFVGVGVAIVGQAVAGLIRWYTEADKAEAATKRLNAALDGQRNKTQELADSYRDLAEQIARAGLSERDRERISRRDQTRQVERTQEQRRRDIATANLPTIGAAGARIDAIDKELEQEANVIARRRLVAERGRLTARIDRQIGSVEQQALQIANTAQRFQGFSAASVLVRGTGGVNQVQRELRRAENRGDTAAVTRLTAQLAALTVAIQILNDRQIISAFDRQQAVSDSLTRAQTELRDVSGPRIADNLANSFSAELQRSVDAFAAGNINAAQFDAAAASVESWVASLEEASIQTGSFTQALVSAASTLASAVEQELAQRSESLRREANAAEARFGANDERTLLLRAQQSDIDITRREAADARRSIDDEIARRRLAFEQTALRGAFDGAENVDPRVNELADRIRRLDALANSAVPDFPSLDARARFIENQQGAAAEAAALRSQLGEVFDALPETQALRRRADEIDIAAQQRLQAIERANEGRELTLTPAERAAEEFADRVAKIREYADQAVNVSSGLPADIELIRERENNAISRLTEETFRQAAPAIFGFADAVANALLQGPSRAALNVADVSTVDGARELNRLIRGDDPARDQNLVELRKQSDSLRELVQQGRERGAIPVAN